MESQPPAAKQESAPHLPDSFARPLPLPPDARLFMGLLLHLAEKWAYDILGPPGPPPGAKSVNGDVASREASVRVPRAGVSEGAKSLGNMS